MSAAIQFDVFLGYDGIVPEATWFPIVFEIKNDGPSFTSVVEVSPGNFNAGQVRRMVVELPTGTLKRVVIPMFSTTRGYSTWDMRLLDERGRTRAEQAGVRPRKQVAAGVPVIGALPRTAGGVPTFHPVRVSQPEWQPASARFQVSIFPDNPLVLEGMNCLYLSSERALDLSVAQVNAIYAWVHAGGHLIIAVDQVTDINSKPWLKELFPCTISDMATVRGLGDFHRWIRSPVPASEASLVAEESPSGMSGRRGGRGGLVPNPFGDLIEDPQFRDAELQAAVGKPRTGAEVLIAAGEIPLVVSASRGLGKVTGLMFSPEREPVRSWRHLPVFWSRLAEVPEEYFVNPEIHQAGSWSSDGIFGALIDSRQINNLPVHWLLLLLVVYLAVIGPIDQYWLKRIGRPMLTWITFPCYVVFFSLLIYAIGYKLRAGESEWNEIHVVDVLQGSGTTQFRGRTYASVYAPSNQRYDLEGRQKYATLRGEFAGSWGAGQSAEKGSVTQVGDTYQAEVFVPVWTSQMLVSDWWQPGSVPVEVTMKPYGDGFEATIRNRTDRKLSNAYLAFGAKLTAVGELGPGQTRTLTVGTTTGMSTESFVQQHGSMFQNAVQTRRNAWGQSGRLDDLPNDSIAACLLDYLPQRQQGYNPGFISPPGLELTPALNNGSVVLLAWDSGYSPVKSMKQFTARRGGANTLWRVVVQL